jgi:hypothetical protein
MKKFLKSTALIAALALVFAACEQAAIGSAGEAPLGAAASLNAVKGIKAPPSTWQQFAPLPFSDVPAVDMVRALTTNGSFLVAAGSDGTDPYATRYDTISGAWTKSVVLPGFTVNPGAAHFLNGYFLVTGATTSSYGAYSTDGLTWKQTGYIGFGTKAGVYGYGEELYVVAGQNGQAAYAYDPSVPFITIPQTYTGWTGTGPTAYINAGAYGDGVYVFGGGSGRIAWTDTILDPVVGIAKWVQVSSPFGSDEFVNAIAYGGNKTFVAVGNNASNNGGIIAYSTNGGQTWAPVTTTVIGANAGIYAVTFGDGYFVAADNDGNFAYSTDGMAWTEIPGSVFTHPSRINATVFYDAVNAFLVAGQDANGVQVAESD